MSQRADGRQALELRPLAIAFPGLARADGSASFGFGTPSALSSFSGPLEVRLTRELPDRATSEIIHRPLEGSGALPSRSVEQTIEALLPVLLNLGAHPRSLVQLILQSLEPSAGAAFRQTRAGQTVRGETPGFELDVNPETVQEEQEEDESAAHTWPPKSAPHGFPRGSGSTDKSMGTAKLALTPAPVPESSLSYSSRAALINSAVLALLDAASVPMRSVVCAVALATVRGDLVLDPSVEEEERAEARYGFGWAFGVGIGIEAGEVGVKREGNGMQVDGLTEGEGEGVELVWSESAGTFSPAEFTHAMRQSKAAAQRILQVMREEMDKRIRSRLA